MKAALRGFFWFAVIGTTLAWSQTFNTPIRHVIVVVQENRTPDNLFGSDLHNSTRLLPGADLVGSGQCKTHTPTTVQLQPESLSSCWDPDHSHANGWVKMYDAGKMDDVCDAGVSWGPHCIPFLPAYPFVFPYTYVDNSSHVLDPYFNIAQNYGYANYMFQSNQGPSFPAHQFLLSGTSAPVPFNDPTGEWTWFESENVIGSSGASGCPAPSGAISKELKPDGTSVNLSGACYEHPTMTDLLDNAGLTWRWYGHYSATQGTDPNLGSQRSLWNAPNAISHMCLPLVPAYTNGPLVCGNSDWTGSSRKIDLTIGDLFYDLGDNTNNACNLPNVSWVIPDGHWSDHPGNDPNAITDGGPSWVAAIVNGIAGYGNTGGQFPKQCNYWSNTAVIVVWDDWGGWYDHVLPWNCTTGPNGTCSGYSNLTGEQYVYGFRVPMLVVSAYTPAGYISGDTRTQNENPPYVHDFGSILNFIEYVFGTGGNFLGGTSGIGNPSYPYADALAPDGPNNLRCGSACPYGLSDFFGGFRTQRSFSFVNGTKYATNCFINSAAPGCFGTAFAPIDPDDDATE